MLDLYYEKLSVLVVDDFESFRLTISKMLQELGVKNIETVASGTEALRHCELRTYDVILCDQNLGKGKSGQQVLENLRHTKNPNSDSLFVLVSAESNKSIIMAAYDYEPDDYLTKPLTAKTLEQRLNRLLMQRLTLTPIINAIKENDSEQAIELCCAELKKNSRYINQCQKILGGLLLDSMRLDEAEALYRDILDIRHLDWAMLGMAKVKIAQGDSLNAQQWLEDLIQAHPHYLKAYDVLLGILRERGDRQALQKILEKTVDISPLSILRQQALGDAALKNNDLVASSNALRKAVKLGEFSCHDNIKVHVDFSQTAIEIAKIDQNIAKPLLRDALKAATELSQRFGKTTENKINSLLLETRLQVAAGEERRSLDAFTEAQQLFSQNADELNVDTKIQWVNALRSRNKIPESQQAIAALIKSYEGDEDALEKIDSLLEEPCSQKNKALLDKINKEGISFYQAKNFVRAAECFNSAVQEMPQHVGLRLNYLQAVIEHIKQEPSEQQLKLAQNARVYVSKLISQQHAQYPRFRQLDDALKAIESGKANEKPQRY